MVLARRMSATDSIMKILVLAFIGGILSLLLGNLLFATLSAIPLLSGLTLVVGIVLVIFTAQHSRIDDMKWFDAVMLFIGIAVVGAVITSFVPSVSMFIISLSDVTLTGVIFSLFYVLSADAVSRRFLGLK